MNSVAVAMVCKTPMAGQSKTRLSPPLSLDACARLSACFIADVAARLAVLAAAGGITPYAVYAPEGSEAALRALLPTGFPLLAQSGGDLGDRMTQAVADLLDAGHAGVVLIGSDSPTLPHSILAAAIDAVRGGDRMTIGPALDGGYTLMGLSKPHPELFRGVPWSTREVYETTLQRAREIALPVTNLPAWYDVDDLASLRMLDAELAGTPPPFAAPETVGGDPPATRRFLASLSLTIA